MGKQQAQARTFVRSDTFESWAREGERKYG